MTPIMLDYNVIMAAACGRHIIPLKKREHLCKLKTSRTARIDNLRKQQILDFFKLNPIKHLNMGAGEYNGVNGYLCCK